MPRLLAQSRIHAPSRLLADWHFRPGAFERLGPPWQRIEVVERPERLEDGAMLRMRLRMGPLGLTWIARHEQCEPGRRFVDVQERGPFGAWRHEHRFEDAGAGACELTDSIEYAPPGGALGRLLAGAKIRRDLDRLFTWRHERTRVDLERHAQWTGPPKRIVVTGASGMIGSALCAFLSTGGHEVRTLVRREARPGALFPEFRWDPDTGEADSAAFDGADALVHLAGSPIAQRWTARARREIDDSRAGATRRLLESLVREGRCPPVVLCASGVGILAPSSTPVDESGALGEDFPSRIAQGWEEATTPAADAGARVVCLRYGVVLSPLGGMLRAVLPVFRLGLGAAPGSGAQRLSWIGLDDAVGATAHALGCDDLRGAVHVTAPGSVSAAEFADTLARVLRRPRLLRMPAGLIRRTMGERGESLLLQSLDADPRALRESGFSWRRPTLDDTLRFELGRLRPAPGRVRFS
ncbi:MAG: TIGR01777 family oxidoreductase [Phycisphaerales bacterium]